ncbi:hypothetical protein F5B19DRAFT_457751 [Rostrohypoxylon terebratum]|nr:hypothetical protein F5B19DRAFT_457751 [Rostrohypoxylon terebratum]
MKTETFHDIGSKIVVCRLLVLLNMTLSSATLKWSCTINVSKAPQGFNFKISISFTKGGTYFGISVFHVGISCISRTVT